MAEGTAARQASCPPAICFEAQIQGTGGSTIVRLPDEASAKLPSRGQVAVKGAVNGYAFQTVLEPDGRRGHWLKVDKKLRQALAPGEGDTVEIIIEPAKDWPEPDIPRPRGLIAYRETILGRELSHLLSRSDQASRAPVMRLLDLNEAASKSAEIKGPPEKLTKFCVAPRDSAGYSRARIPRQPLLNRTGKLRSHSAAPAAGERP